MLVLLSNFTRKDNKELINRVVNNFSNGKYNLAYVPSCTDSSRKYYIHVKSMLNEYGNFQYEYYDIDENCDSIDFDKLFSSDVIYLSGGNTFYFLNNIKKNNLIDRFRSYVKTGGNIIGLSAGAIILSQSIEIAKFGGENICEIEDFSALGLVQFDFIPHWNMGSHNIYELKHFSKKNKKVIYTCNDGDGIIVDKENIELYGSITKIDYSL
ncbi:Type 1 glutamine amidotransferase-like domain-containing protein [Abyssisolibacter fermentans]|uniref:Type 1 glutamine amidotransferase-like domain-containing protein n=1 Tax=Abyssisolibacter fermentans TaxID=1766203 RepID=UPI000833F1BA|nr:Type 1 glutamine amidotransferase-like domain-containing protein [Abyssisolibacter fermentans]